MKKIPLHLQILAALILGAAFGSFFSIDSNKIKITYLIDSKEHDVEIKNWDSFRFVENDSIVKSFNSKSQNGIIKYYDKVYKNNPANILVESSNGDNSYSNIINLTKESTPATIIKPIGDIFIRLLSFLAIPLVITSLIVGASSLGDVKKLGRIGFKTFTIYIATTAIAIVIGLTLANIIQPGEKLSVEAKSKLISSNISDTPSKDITSDLKIDIIDFIVNIVPKNPFQALNTGNMLQIVFFAVFFGIVMTFIPDANRELLIGVFNATSDTLIKMVEIVMLLAPFGVFALIASTVADFGFDILSTLFWYMLTVLLGLLLHMMLIYVPMVKYMGKMSVRNFFRGIQNAQAIAFSTSSSAATLPVTMECVEKNLGVPKRISGFVLPLGATINMDGTALYQGVAAVFIAQVYGIPLGLPEQLTIVFTAVLASIGTAPVPGVGLIMLVMILQSVHIPPEGIALIIGVDRLLDMARTINNITGDSVVAVVIASSERNKV